MMFGDLDRKALIPPCREQTPTTLHFTRKSANCCREYATINFFSQFPLIYNYYYNYQCVILIVRSNNYDNIIFIIHQWFCMRPECLDMSLRQLHTCEWNINAA